MRVLRALRAKHGDSLLLLGEEAKVLIDGGPSGVYRQTLRDNLADLEGEKGDPPRLDLLVVSHIDADHIDGVLDLTAEMLEARAEKRQPLVRIDRAWHNSFADAIAQKGTTTPKQVKTSAASVAGLFTQLTGARFAPHPSRLVLSSVSQGRQLRLDLKTLKIGLNRHFQNRWVLQDKAARPWTKGDLKMTVVGPTQKEIDDLREKWAKELPKILAKKGAVSVAAAKRLDRSISNLASIVAVAEMAGKKALLTGDARGDMILKWLWSTGDLKPGKSLHFHIIKLPHHGSDRNVSADFFKRLTADHYVVCGNGGHGNPEPNTFELLFSARPDLDYTVHMTYGPDELKKNRSFKKAGNVPKLDAVLADPTRKAVLKFPGRGQSHVDVAF